VKNKSKIYDCVYVVMSVKIVETLCLTVRFRGATRLLNFREHMPGILFTPPTLESISKLLPAYEFTELFSSNERGAVYFANQRSLDRVVAIKVQSAKFDVARQESKEAYIKAVAALKHPNLVSIFDSGQLEGMGYYILEFVPGKSLGRSTAGHAVEFAQAMSIMKGICEGISHAHGNGVIHGNLNPSNVLLNQKVEPKIMNFGSRATPDESLGRGGEKRFMAPEVKGGGEATKSSDIYSLGAIFYELMTGVAYGEGAVAASTLCGCKKGVDEVLKKALSAEPASRMTSAKDFLDALDKAANGTSSLAVAGAGAKVGKPTSSLATASKVGAKSRIGGANNLVLKVVVIVILAIAVQQTWSYLKDVKAERSRENAEILARQDADRERRKAEGEVISRLVHIPRNGNNGFLSEREEEEEETTEDSLERLQSALLLGRREEMPVGSKKIGGNDYLYVADEMSWHDAALYAEEYGGHLVTDVSAVGEISKDVAEGEEFWSGAGWSGTSWAFMDGQDMLLSPSGEGKYVYVNNDGSLVATDHEKECGFVIQWRGDGSNPGALKAQLEKTRASLGGSSVFYPVGTILAGERRLLCVPREMSWEEAVDFAKLGGGELMVVSDDEEEAALKKTVENTGKDKTFWLGGFLEGMYWKWVTEEPWRGVKWSDEDNAMDDDVALVARSDGSWAARDRSEMDSGFIIEWSSDASKKKGTGNGSGDSIQAAEELIAKAEELVIASGEKREEGHKVNDDKFNWDLKGYVKVLNKTEQERWEPVIDELKRCVGNERILTQEINQRGISVAQDMVKYVVFYERKQGEINALYTKELEKIREAFVAKMSAMRDVEKEGGQVKVVAFFDEKLKDAETLDGWVESFGLAVAKPPVYSERDDEGENEEEEDF
jgi:serine/threonine protein kinase